MKNEKTIWKIIVCVLVLFGFGILGWNVGIVLEKCGVTSRDCYCYYIDHIDTFWLAMGVGFLVVARLLPTDD
ncbi:hypothetical protein AGMMS4956_07500 [Bacteroidia bacterium]|nr:hypothetical protein AGMMS4956_07500 [Bacteroidia bacterium]